MALSYPARQPVTQTVSLFFRAQEKGQMSMKLGIQKRQWFFLVVVLLLPLLLNTVAIWLNIGTDGILRLLGGTYQPSNPNLPIASLSAILSELLLYIAGLGVLSWLVIFVSNKGYFQKQGLPVKSLEILVIVLLIAKVFEVVTGFFMPFAWLPEFYDLLGLPGSPFATNWSHWFIFPATAIILFIVLTMSRNKNLEGKKIGKTVDAL